MTSRETALVERARRGDRLAFAALYERFAPVVHGVLLSGLPADEVDDHLQEVFLAAWKSLSSLRATEHVGGWLCAIARNRVRKRWQRARPRVPLPPDVVDVRGEARASSTPDSEEILGVLRELPETYRETLTLRLVEGLTGPEIAEATGLTPASVRVNLNRGMKQLRERLGRKGWS